MSFFHQLAASTFFREVAPGPGGYAATDFTFEWYQKQTGAGGGFPRPFSLGSWPSAQLAIEWNTSGTAIALWTQGNYAQSFPASVLNTWAHVAITRQNGVIKMWLNGQDVFTGDNTNLFEASVPFYVGGEGSPEGRWQGHIRDFHIVRGTALYSAPFSPGFITSYPGTILLLRGDNSENLLLDSGPYSRTPQSSSGVVFDLDSPYGEGNPGSLLFDATGGITYDSATLFSNSYLWYRFVTLATRNNSATSVQLSELEILLEGSRVDYTNATADNPGGDNPPGETAAQGIDNNVATKWLDFNKGSLSIEFPVATTADGFRYVTANDSSDRDPVRWTLQGSLDGSSWISLHLQETSNATIPLARETATSIYSFAPF